MSSSLKYIELITASSVLVIVGIVGIIVSISLCFFIYSHYSKQKTLKPTKIH